MIFAFGTYIYEKIANLMIYLIDPGDNNDFSMIMAGPFRRFSTRVWQNARANTVRRAMVCDVYFPFSKTL